MNQWDVEEARARYRNHPILGPATATLISLVSATNRNSDGWSYWPKPSRAARKLMALVEGDRMARFDDERADATVAKLRAAYVPLKSFRTRQGLAFDIVEVSDDGAPVIFARI